MQRYPSGYLYKTISVNLDPRSQVAGGYTQVVIRTNQLLLILTREVRWQAEIPKWLSHAETPNTVIRTHFEDDNVFTSKTLISFSPVLRRTRRRGRGRGSYQSDAPRGRFNPRNFGRGHGEDGSDREYNKSKGSGRGRGSYQSDAPRGRFNPRKFGRGHGEDGSDREYKKSKRNGFYRPIPCQERGNSGHH
ncbi:hypothetical protein JHK84_047604 [Glycine max]|nr:hypothetical protein JHK84_047604 [Glycine max]